MLIKLKKKYTTVATGWKTSSWPGKGKRCGSMSCDPCKS